MVYSEGEVKKNWLSEVDDASVFKHRMQLCAGLVGSVFKLATRAEISQSGIRNYYAGSDPTRDILSRIARAAGVRFEWLGEGTGPVRDLPEIVIQTVLHAFRTYCRQQSLPDSRETRIQFVSLYNDGAITTVERLQTLIPKIAFIELRDWLAEAVSESSASVRDKETAKRVSAPQEPEPSAHFPLIEDLYKEIGRAVDEYLNQKSEKPSVTQVLDYTVRVYRVIYGLGIRKLSPECKKAILPVLRLIDIGAAQSKSKDTVSSTESV